jgi:branched-chain amino acid transport system ATP-binding protein
VVNKGLQVRDIEVVYANAIVALRGVSLDIAPGQCVAVLGANGAGKSTVLKAISGVLASENGRIVCGSLQLDGAPIEPLACQDRVARGVVHVMEGRRVLRHLTVEQNLLLGGHAAPQRAERRSRLEEVFTTIPILERLSGRTAGLLSGGEQQLLVIGRAMMAAPRFMLVDEPSLGLAPLIVRQVFQLLALLRDRGMGILLVEQNARVALQMADTGYVLEDGRVMLHGPATQLRNNDEVARFYLGHHAQETPRRLADLVHTRRRRQFARSLQTNP